MGGGRRGAAVGVGAGVPSSASSPPPDAINSIPVLSSFVLAPSWLLRGLVLVAELPFSPQSVSCLPLFAYKVSSTSIQ